MFKRVQAVFLFLLVLIGFIDLRSYAWAELPNEVKETIFHVLESPSVQAEVASIRRDSGNLDVQTSHLAATLLEYDEEIRLERAPKVQLFQALNNLGNKKADTSEYTQDLQRLLSHFLLSFPHDSLLQAHQSQILEKAKKQVETPFRRKFSPITDDLDQTSHRNIQRLRNLLLSRPKESLDPFEAQAISLLDQIEPRLELEHATSVKSAIQILNTGAIYSADELVRKNLASVENHFRKSTHPEIDGRIGEQDVVFLALKESRDGNPSDFGPVRFIFSKKEVLNQGYLTPFSYGWSYPSHHHRELGRDLYRTYLFQGYDGFRAFLQLSIAETLRSKSEDPTRREEQLKAIEHLISIIEAEIPRNLAFTRFPCPEFKSFFEKKEHDTSFLRNLSLIDLKQLSFAFKERFNRSDIEQFLTAYMDFPSSPTIQGSPLLAKRLGFWEVKVPEQLDLSSLEALRVERRISEELQKQIEVAVLHFSNRTSQRFTRVETSEEIVFRLARP